MHFLRGTRTSLYHLLWIGYFASVALGAFLGGTVHGFHLYFDISLAWLFTLLSLGVASSCGWVLLGYYLNTQQIKKWIYASALIFILYSLCIYCLYSSFILCGYCQLYGDAY